MKLKMRFIFVLILCSLIFVRFVFGSNLTFPDGFMFGVSSSAYQIEGAWNKEGKGINIWDTFTQNYPERISDRSTGDNACNSYYKYKDDIRLLKYLGVNFYRFSISWSRILPTGFTNNVNKAGIEYYNNLIDELIINGIQPMVTLYHWDLPQPLQDLGGWPNVILANYFEAYAMVVFEHFGDRVKMWLTFNEPKLICVYGYGEGKIAPGVKASGIGDYLCGKTILLAHARVYHLYNEFFKEQQQGEIGVSLQTEWFQPETLSYQDIEAARQKMQFDFGWFANPIFSVSGDYPSIMKSRIKRRSAAEGYRHSRLPKLEEDEIDFIKGTYDFLGLNMYTASMVKYQLDDMVGNTSLYQDDVGVDVWKDPSWPTSSAKHLRVVPWSLRKLLFWIKENYGNISIIITENGYADSGDIDDFKRIAYLEEHIFYLLKSIHEDGVQVKGYSVWSLLDSFEWSSGYKEKYGLFSVNFDSPNRERCIKKSAVFYRDLIRTRKLTWFGNNENVFNRANLTTKEKVITISCVVAIDIIIILLFLF